MTRVVSLNVQHGGGRRQSSLARWLLETEADILVLSEWRLSSEPLANDLRSAGYFGSWSLRPGVNVNGVAIFTKAAHRADRVTPENSSKGELLRIDMEHMTVVGAYFPQLGAKAEFFNRCGALADAATHPLLILGDMNTGSNSRDLEPGASKFHCELEFLELTTRYELVDLWRRQHGPDVREWTWRSSRNGFRIDHAFANRELQDVCPDICCVYDHSPRERGITDHSAMVIDL